MLIQVCQQLLAAAEDGSLEKILQSKAEKRGAVWWVTIEVKHTQWYGEVCVFSLSNQTIIHRYVYMYIIYVELDKAWTVPVKIQ